MKENRQLNELLGALSLLQADNEARQHKLQRLQVNL
jgi:hypothetical protein